MFALGKTLPKDESSEDERSGTSTDEDGEPLISAHVSDAVREAVLADVEHAFEWSRFDTWSVQHVAAEFALHVERWGSVPTAAMPSWTAAVATWELSPLPRKPKAKEAAEVKNKDVGEPREAVEEAAVATAAPPASVLPPVGIVPDVLVPALDLDSDVDFATLAVLPELPTEAPSLQQTKQYKNYMKLRYEWQRRHPERDLPKVVSGWYKGGKPSSDDPLVRENTTKASEKLKAAKEQLKAAKEGALPVVKVTHRMSMTSIGDKRKDKDSLSRASDSAEPEKKDRLFSGTKSGKRLSMQSIGKKKGAAELPDEVHL
jgi:hypothetical protein